MNGTIDLFTLISLVVAVVAVLKLRSVLGRRTGDEESRIRARNEERERAAAAQSSEKVITLPRRNRLEPAAEVSSVPAEVEAEERIRTFVGADNPVQRGLLDIVRADPDFDPEHFLDGARQAYEMIVTAFAEGNRKQLRDLLSPEVYEDFSDAISDRESRGERVEQNFVGINKADILEAEVSKGFAQITVRFASQLIRAQYDKSGNLIDGDAGRVLPLTDIFTFSRDVSTARALDNPNWRLVATVSQN